MSDEEFKQSLASIRKFSKEVSSTPEKARAILVEIGVLDPDGNISEEYSKPYPFATQSTPSRSRVSRNRKSGSR